MSKRIPHSEKQLEWILTPYRRAALSWDSLESKHRMYVVLDNFSPIVSTLFLWWLVSRICWWPDCDLCLKRHSQSWTLTLRYPCLQFCVAPYWQRYFWRRTHPFRYSRLLQSSHCRVPNFSHSLKSNSHGGRLRRHLKQARSKVLHLHPLQPSTSSRYSPQLVFHSAPCIDQKAAGWSKTSKVSLGWNRTALWKSGKSVLGW